MRFSSKKKDDDDQRKKKIGTKIARKQFHERTVNERKTDRQKALKKAKNMHLFKDIITCIYYIISKDIQHVLQV